MIKKDEFTQKELVLTCEKEEFGKYQKEEEEDILTKEEIEELTKLHEEAMCPTQNEEDWMLQIVIMKERKNLANKYMPHLSDYKLEDICELCSRYFYQKGNLQTHMKLVHNEKNITTKGTDNSSRRLAF